MGKAEKKSDGSVGMSDMLKLSPEELKQVTGGGELNDVPVVDETPYTDKDKQTV